VSRFGPFFLVIASGLSLLAGPAAAQDTLIWSDEFDGTSIDPNNWEHMIGDGTAYGLPAGWGNNELQYYTSRPENSYVADGNLHIIAREEQYAGCDYTSARLRTQNLRDFLYGRMEARIKLPTGQGMWPAFWMLPTDWVYGGWAASGEIDIIEAVNIPTTVYGTIHYGGQWPYNTSSGGSYSDGTDFSDEFHVYALEWEPDVMHWYVDGIWYHTETSADWYSDGAPDNDRAPFDQRFHFLLNIAVGGNWPGPPDETTVFPQVMMIDWVRVYAFGSQSPFYGDPQVIPGRIEAEDFDLGGEGLAYHDCDAGNNGGAYRPASDVDIEACSEGGYNVGWMCANEWLEYTVDVTTARTYVIEARVASQTTGGTFHVEFDGVDRTGDISVPVSGGWQTWVTVSATADLSAGVREMRFANSDNASDEYNISYFDIRLLADLDLDGDVDLADLAALLAAYGTCAVDPAYRPDADFDSSGCVELADLAALLGNYDTTP